MAKGRVILTLLLVAAGAGLLLYGLFHNSVTVSAPAAAPSPEVPGLEGEPSITFIAAESEALSEPALTVEVARGGVTRDEAGQIQKTYTGAAPKACPT